MQLENSLAFLSLDLSGSVESAMIPATMLKSLPERMVNVKGYVAEVMATSSNNRDSYGGNYSHTTYFVKVVLFLQALPPLKSNRRDQNIHQGLPGEARGLPEKRHPGSTDRVVEREAVLLSGPQLRVQDGLQTAIRGLLGER